MSRTPTRATRTPFHVPSASRSSLPYAAARTHSFPRGFSGGDASLPRLTVKYEKRQSTVATAGGGVWPHGRTPTSPHAGTRNRGQGQGFKRRAYYICVLDLCTYTQLITGSCCVAPRAAAGALPLTLSDEGPAPRPRADGRRRKRGRTRRTSVLVDLKLSRLKFPAIQVPKSLCTTPPRWPSASQQPQPLAPLAPPGARVRRDTRRMYPHHRP